MSSKLSEFEIDVLNAIKHIEDENNDFMYTYVRTISSFLKGAKNSPFFDIYKKYPDVCGKYPKVTILDIMLALHTLVVNGNIKKYISDSEKEYYKVIKSGEPDFVEKCTDREKSFIRKIERKLNDIDGSLKSFDKKAFYGFKKEDDPHYLCWITRDKSALKHLILKLRKSVNDEGVYKTFKINNNTIDEIIRQINLLYFNDANKLELIKTRIINKDKFSEYNSNNKKDVTLMAHQKAGVELSNIYNRFAYFFDTGTGKTIMALEIMMNKHLENDSKFLVVTPKPLIKAAWLEDSLHFKGMKLLPISNNMTFNDYGKIFNRWNEIDNIENQYFFDSDGNFVCDLDKSTLLSQLIKRADHYVINIEAIRSTKQCKDLLNKINFNGLILDESVIIKNYESQNARRIRVLSKKLNYVYLLSGMPAPNNSIEYYSQMMLVDKDNFNISYNEFIDRYYKKTKYGKLVDINQHTKNEVAKMVANRSLIMKKEDCIDLPEIVFCNRLIELDRKSMESYQDILNNLTTYLISLHGDAHKVKGKSFSNKTSKLREIASGFYLNKNNAIDLDTNKLDSLINLIEEIGYQNEPYYDSEGNEYYKRNKVLIWCNFKHEIETIEEKLTSLGYKVVTGYSETKDIDKSIYDFQKGDAEIMIANLKSLKFGVTLTSCHYAIFNSLSYSYDDYYQAVNRIYRKGQDKPCFIFHLLSENTIDEITYEVIQNKGKLNNSFEKLIKKSSKFNLDKKNLIKVCNELEKISNEEIHL